MALPIAAALGRIALGSANMAGANLGRSIGLSQVTSGLSQLAKSATGAMGAVTGLASSITGGLLGPLSHVQEMFDHIGKLVGLFNPGIVAQFTLAMNDTMAVIGSALVPVLQGATDYVRMFGDALAKLLPVIQPLFDSIGQFLSNFAQGFAPILEAAAPFIEMFSDAMSNMLKHLSIGIALVQGAVAELIEIVATLLGMDTSRFKQDANSRGFAARQTKVQSVEQFARDVFASTAKNIYARQGGGKKPEALMEEIKIAIEKGREFVKAIAEDVSAIADWITKRKEQAEKFAEGAGVPVRAIEGRANRELTALDREANIAFMANELRRLFIKPGGK